MNSQNKIEMFSSKEEASVIMRAVRNSNSEFDKVVTTGLSPDGLVTIFVNITYADELNDKVMDAFDKAEFVIRQVSSDSVLYAKTLNARQFVNGVLA